MLKKILFTYLFVFIFITYNYAKGPQGVSFTKHNLANWNDAADHFKTINVNEVCVFCHTPHNSPNYPLWNRDVIYRTDDLGNIINVQDLALNPTAFYAYSTRTISQVPLKLGYQTLLCMSCHDGVTSMGVLNRLPKSLKGAQIQWFGNTDQIGKITPSPADIGNASTFSPNLSMYSYGVNKKVNAYAYYTDGLGMMFGIYQDPGTGEILGNTADHPISINYDYIVTKKPSKFYAKNQTDLRFFHFNGGTGGYLLECSTCHDPHVNYDETRGGDKRYKPFLAMSNSSSAMCLKCHKK